MSFFASRKKKKRGTGASTNRKKELSRNPNHAGSIEPRRAGEGQNRPHGGTEVIHLQKWQNKEKKRNRGDSTGLPKSIYQGQAAKRNYTVRQRLRDLTPLPHKKLHREKRSNRKDSIILKRPLRRGEKRTNHGRQARLGGYRRKYRRP